MGNERGQASVELVAGLPALLLAALLSLQLLAAGYALTLADGAAEAGALALASGGGAKAAARAALPGWAEDDVHVSVRGGRVTVRLRAPSPFRGIADRQGSAGDVHGQHGQGQANQADFHRFSPQRAAGDGGGPLLPSGAGEPSGFHSR